MRTPLILRLLLIATIVASCTDPTLNGVVLDNKGQPIEGATVSIQNSQFKSVTDQSGRYSLDFVPGNLQVNYTKADFIGDSLVINIAQKEEYPIDTIILVGYPILADVAAIVEEQGKNYTQKALIVGPVLFDKRFINVRDVIHCRQACMANRKLIEKYRQLEQKGLISINTIQRKSSPSMNAIERNYYDVAISEPYKTLVVETGPLQGSPCGCIDMWQWEERYKFAQVKIAHLKVDSLLSIEMDAAQKRCGVKYRTVVDSLTAFGDYFQATTGQTSEGSLALRLVNNQWIAK